MPLSVQQFIENLCQTGLMSAAEVSTICDACRPTSGRGTPEPWQNSSSTRDDSRLIRRRQSSKASTAPSSSTSTSFSIVLALAEWAWCSKPDIGGWIGPSRSRCLPAAAMKSPDAVERFYREVQAAAKLSHPNIVAAHDASEHEGIHYLVMEYVDGKDLAAIVQEQGPLSVAQAVECILQAARGLEYAHAKGIVHRDIKPSNLLLTPNGSSRFSTWAWPCSARVALRRAPGAGQLTQTGQIMGTLDYMAPSRRSTPTRPTTERHLQPRCTLYYLLTARAVYHGDTVVAVLVAHREAPIPSLCARAADVPQELDAVFQRMVAKRPADRQQSMGQVITELNACLVGDAAPSNVAVEPSSGSTLSELVRTASSEVVTVKPQLATAADQETLKLTHQDQDTGKELPVVGPEPSGEPAEPTRRRSRFWLIASSGAIGLFIVLAVVFGRQFLPGVTQNSDGTGNSGTGSSGAETAATPHFDSLTVGAKAGDEWSGNSLGMKFCWCPEGNFKMGERTAPVKVKLTPGFWLGKYEVTQGEYRQLKKSHHSHFSPTGGGKAHRRRTEHRQVPC